MIETKMFGAFQEREMVTIVITSLLRKKTYITGEVMGVREHMGKEYLIIKPKDSHAIDVSLAHVDQVRRDSTPSPIEPAAERPKYNRV